MTAMVVYESMYGNTRAVAEAIVRGLGGAVIVPAHADMDLLSGADLLVVGGPTHVHGMAGARTREAAVEAARKSGSGRLEPNATGKPGLRDWLDELPNGVGTRAAAFDTRLNKPVWFTGAASHGIEKRLRGHGYDVIASESFLVSETEGPLVEGELERAERWGQQLAESLTSAAVDV